MIIENLDIWKILGIVTVILLIAFWRRRSAVWGGLTIGIIIGFVIVIFYLFKGGGFNWFVIGKGAILGTMVGLIAELLGKISDLIRRKRSKN
jgi:hypothetical protein